jgi:hypothetical protein
MPSRTLNSCFVGITGLVALLLPRHPGAVAGTVTDDAGHGVLGVRVTLDQDCSTTSGPDGRFGFSSVEHGEHLLRASTPGFAPYEDTILVKAGDTLRLSVALVPTMTPGQRDSARAALVALFSATADSPLPGEFWIRDCR